MSARVVLIGLAVIASAWAMAQASTAVQREGLSTIVERE